MEATIPTAKAAEISGYGNRLTVQRLQKKAREQGYNPAVSTWIEVRFVEDVPRSGRLKVADKAKEQAIIEISK